MFFAHPVRNLKRLRDVQAILLRYGFDFLFESEEIKQIRDTLGRGFKRKAAATAPLPERARLMIEELGPTYIKLGQILSSRSDLLPPNWRESLSKLQDNVPPFPFTEARDTIEEDLGKPLSEIFLDFDPQPIAAASIGQVHRARLLNGDQVVVKIRRPRIVPQVQSDLEIIREISKQVESRTRWGRNYAVDSIMEEFHHTILLEMDYRNEASNAIRLRRILADVPGVHVPYIYWGLSSERVLTMEYIDGLKVTDIARLDQAGVDRKKLADSFIRSIFKQLLIEGFYHADPHPGNLLVRPEDQTLVYIDLGMMGSLLPEQRQILGDIIRSMLRRDSMDVTRLVLEVGIPFDKVDEKSLCRSIDQLINRYLELSLEDISFATLVSEILVVIIKHSIRLPSEFSLALKTIVQAEEVARTLDKKIVIIDLARSISQQLILQAITPAKIMDQFNDGVREFSRLRKVVPRALESILKQIESGTFTVAVDVPDFENITHSILVIANRLTAGLVVTGMVIGSAIAMGTSPEKTWAFIPILGIIGFIASLLLGGLLVWGVARDIISAGRKRRRKKF